MTHCWLCELPLTNNSSTNGILVDKMHCLVCASCSEEANKKFEYLKSQLEYNLQKLFSKWAKEQKAVKRFYNRQLTLDVQRGR